MDEPNLTELLGRWYSAYVMHKGDAALVKDDLKAALKDDFFRATAQLHLAQLNELAAACGGISFFTQRHFVGSVHRDILAELLKEG